VCSPHSHRPDPPPHFLALAMVAKMPMAMVV
jgi:hypothetical protein